MSGSITLAVSLPQFRQDMSEFADSSLYTDNAVNYWLTLGTQLLDPHRWGVLLTMGLEQFTAHNLVLEQQADRTASRGGIPGQATGIVAGKSVGAVSVSYDTQSGVELDGGHWNMTVYGRRFIRTARLVGTGGAQLYV